MRRLFLLTAVLILYGSLFPWMFHPLDPSLSIGDQLRASWPDQLDRWLVKDFLLNLGLYFVFGFIGALAYPHGWKSWAVPILSGMALSATVEYTQLYTYTRVTSAFDFVTNSAGAVIGAAAAHRARMEWRNRLQLRGSPVDFLILALFVSWQLFPFFPVSGRTALYANLADLPQFGWLTFGTAFAGWICGGLAARALLPGRRVFALALVLLVKPLILGRGLTLAEIAAAGLALTLVSATALPSRIAAALVAALILLREVMPLRFSTTASAFNWIPFKASLGAADWLRSCGVLVDKLFLITAALWLLRRSGIRLWFATAAMAAGLFGLELLQTYLPGRTPESTDAAIALAAGLLLDLVDGRHSSG